ncbi:hypothetical protein ACQEU8_00125 [Streptomyces sp. CA-250714]|uniref:hypothetical protein n=1 Tax=Streptomyces sp. CA-250714 TaxID=3240060 RepID=UPI003D921F24
MAAAGVTDAGLELLAASDDSGRLELLEQVRKDGNHDPNEVLDDALATILAGACPTLREATDTPDPSQAAEHCPTASRRFAQTVPSQASAPALSPPDADCRT